MKTGSRTARNNAGFTLLEMMITLAVVAVLLSAAVPSVSTFIKNNRITSRMNSIIADLHYARSKAVSSGATIIMCRSADPTAPSPSCGGTQQVWTGGYLIFADDGTHANTVYDAGTDTLLRRGESAPQDVAIHTNTTWDSNIRFDYSGTTEGNGSTALMSICDDRGTGHGRIIKVMPSGTVMTSSVTSPSCVL
jgi:prepilin-type N-terminal cleavage/methylation domain-containing protein